MGVSGSDPKGGRMMQPAVAAVVRSTLILARAVLGAACQNSKRGFRLDPVAERSAQASVSSSWVALRQLFVADVTVALVATR